VKQIDNKSLRTLTYLSCRSAIKAGDSLTHEERWDLLRQLAACELPYTCPHGRPVKIEITLNELERMFKRKV
jgi:DNA mismatch repair protein MutL